MVVRQPASADVERWLEDDRDPVAWTLTQVEVVSALERLVRDAELPERAARDAEEVAIELLRHVHLVTDVERVKELACRLLRVHALRGADAIQLGAALAWADGPASGLVLHTFDRRMALAAEREGFRVIPVP